MIAIKSVLLATLLALVAAGPTARSGMVVRESKSAVPDGFVVKSAAPADQTIPLRIALVQSDMAGLEKALYDVSTPSSPNYGKHLSKEEVEEYVKPSQAAVDAVNAYLKANGVEASTMSPAGDWLGFSIPISKANDMFNADFSVYQHVASGTEQIRTLSYSIPSSLSGHLDYVHPTTNFITGSPRLPLIVSPLPSNATGLTPATAAACGSTVTPACLQSLYGIPTTKATQSTNQLAVAGFLGQWAQKADLKSFLSALRPDLSSATTFALDTLDAGSNPQGSGDAGIEANLDIQYTVGLASGVPVTFVSAGSSNSDGWSGFLDMVNYLLALPTIPHVLTTSYAFNEPGLSASATNTLCNAYMQLGARGTSILFASGDGGVSGGQSQSCTTFIPTFPSTCPYVTSVGGTTGTTEVAAGLSGGGFSTIFTAPSYQSAVTAAYVKSIGTTYSGKYTGTGRGFPDISAIAENVEIYNGGTAELVAGTSCATPISASIFSLINDQLVAAGKSPLGFLNPWLYANPTALNDITSGTNPGCSTNGFSAKAGWDPVTGLGSPNFAKLKTAAGL
ncbi:family S53 protease [Athelia psychrophila]|uniref:Family S53 protease n=1 Tax=Athelia psychrophila TaxID=1759441 RepID=A0A166DKU9_9AGAM|nr:family S53 protease [Fibularhizoctonia sp. CBS 109695]